MAIFSKMAAPALSSPLHSEQQAAEHVGQAHISTSENVAPHAQSIVAESHSRKRQRNPSLLREVLIRATFLELDRVDPNATAATEAKPETGSLPPVNPSGLPVEQGSTQGSRKRKAPEVERGSLKKLKEDEDELPTLSLPVVESIPGPSAPAPTGAWLHSSTALHSDVQDAVSFGGVSLDGAPGFPADEHALTATQASHGAPGDMDEYGFQIVSVPPSLDEYLFPLPDLSADPSVPSQPVFDPTLGWELPSHLSLMVNPQDLVANMPAVSPPSSPQSPLMSSILTPAMILQTQGQDIATGLMEENGAESGLSEMSNYGEVDVSVGEPSFDLEAIIRAYISDGDLDPAFEGSSDACYDPLGPAGIPSDVDPWGEDAEDYTSFQAVPAASEVC